MSGFVRLMMSRLRCAHVVHRLSGLLTPLLPQERLASAKTQREAQEQRLLGKLREEINMLNEAIQAERTVRPRGQESEGAEEEGRRKKEGPVEGRHRAT